MPSLDHDHMNFSTFYLLLWKVAQVACEFMLSLLTLSNSTTFTRSFCGKLSHAVAFKIQKPKHLSADNFYSCKEPTTALIGFVFKSAAVDSGLFDFKMHDSFIIDSFLP